MDISKQTDKLNNLHKEVQQTDILSGLKTMNIKDPKLMRKKFEV